MPRNVYEVIVERKIRNRFLIEARSGSEAAMRVGANLAGAAPFENVSTEQEVDRRILAPKILPGAGPQQVIEFLDQVANGAPVTKRPESLGIVEDRTPEQLAADGDAPETSATLDV